MVQLETARLILRSWRLDDVEDLYAYAKNPNIGPRAGWPPHVNRSESLRIIQSFMLEDDVWALVEKKSQKVIGSIGLHQDRKRNNRKARMIGFVLHEEYWGQGLIVEAVKEALRYAFDDLHLNIVSVYHYPFNTQSKRVIEKCGFTYEGVLREASIIYDGHIYDDVCYSITKDEYTRLLDHKAK